MSTHDGSGCGHRPTEQLADLLQSRPTELSSQAGVDDLPSASRADRPFVVLRARNLTNCEVQCPSAYYGKPWRNAIGEPGLALHPRLDPTRSRGHQIIQWVEDLSGAPAGFHDSRDRVGEGCEDVPIPVRGVHGKRERLHHDGLYPSPLEPTWTEAARPTVVARASIRIGFGLCHDTGDHRVPIDVGNDGAAIRQRLDRLGSIASSYQSPIALATSIEPA